MGQDASRRWWPDRHRPRGRRLARVSVLALVAGLAAGMLTGAASVLPAATHGSALHSYIVRARPGQLAQAAGLLRDRHIRM
jgi:uncharacterized membrane protein YdjX (TVP38/TMEM64 family)